MTCEKKHWWSSVQHNFGRWEIFEKGSITEGFGEMKRTTGKYIYQKRICKRCGFIELNYQEVF